jgi:hypothetical protein
MAPWNMLGETLLPAPRTKSSKRHFMPTVVDRALADDVRWQKYIAPPCELLSFFLCGLDSNILWIYKMFASTTMAIVRSIRKIGFIIDFTGN